MSPRGAMPAPGPWEPAVEPTLPGLPPSKNYIVVNTLTGEEHGRPKTYAAAKAQAEQLNTEEANGKK